jgi:hypothetical protein
MFRLLRSGYLKRWLRYNALRKGLLGRQGPWMAVFVAGVALRQVNKVLKRGPMPVRFSEKLEPGATYVISHIVPPTRRQRRKASRAMASRAMASRATASRTSARGATAS